MNGSSSRKERFVEALYEVKGLADRGYDTQDETRGKYGSAEYTIVTHKFPLRLESAERLLNELKEIQAMQIKYFDRLEETKRLDRKLMRQRLQEMRARNREADAGSKRTRENRLEVVHDSDKLPPGIDSAVEDYKRFLLERLTRPVPHVGFDLLKKEIEFQQTELLECFDSLARFIDERKRFSGGKSWMKKSGETPFT